MQPFRPLSITMPLALLTLGMMLLQANSANAAVTCRDGAPRSCQWTSPWTGTADGPVRVTIGRDQNGVHRFVASLRNYPSRMQTFEMDPRDAWTFFDTGGNDVMVEVP